MRFEADADSCSSQCGVDPFPWPPCMGLCAAPPPRLASLPANSLQPEPSNSALPVHVTASPPAQTADSAGIFVTYFSSADGDCTVDNTGDYAALFRLAQTG